MDINTVDYKDKRKLNLIFACVQIFFWCANCAYFSFLVLYLRERSYNETTIGLLMTMLSILNLVAPSLIGYISDFFIPIKKVVIGSMFLSIFAAFFLSFTYMIVPIAFLSVACMGVLERSLVSVIDSWGMKIKAKKPYLNYGLTRGLASLIYAVVALVLGQVLDNIGLENLFYFHAIFATLAVVSALFLDNIGCNKTPSKKDKKSYFSVVNNLLKNKKYMFLVVAMICSGVGLVSTYTFLPLLLEEMGGTSVHLGIALFLSAGSEVPAMLLNDKISKRFSSQKLLLAAFFFMILRIYSLVLAPNLFWVIAVQVLQAFSFGLYLPSVLMYLGKITPKKAGTTAITFAIACESGIAGIFGNAAGGAIAQYFSVKSVFISFGIFAIIGFLVFSYSVIKHKDIE